MNPSLNLLTSTREARREAAVTRLALATRQFEDACSVCAQALQALEQAKQWHQDVARQCVLGQDPAIREALGPACAALIEARHEQFVASQDALRQAQTHVHAQRQHLTACERDTLRLEEWQKIERDQVQRAQALLEDRQDDELPGQRQARRGAP